jgi:uncharacterized protein (DUF1800 family)
MNGNQSTLFTPVAYALFIFICLAVPSSAQRDPNPNSPAPVLLSSRESTRALAEAYPRRPSRQIRKDVFELNSRVRLYVSDVVLMKGEEETAFRVYAEDSQRRTYRFPVVAVQQIESATPTYALTVELRDELDHSLEPPAKGDVLISVAWRGMVSNRLRLGLGATGGAIKDDAAQPRSLIADQTDDANQAKKLKENLRHPRLTTSTEKNPTDAVGYWWSGDRIRFLEQATFGPTPALDERIRRIGIRTWLAEQFEMTLPSAGNPYPNFPLMPTSPPSHCNGQVDGELPDPDPFCFSNHYTMYPMQNWFYREAFYGDAQLRHRVAWALAQMWVISGDPETQQASHMAAYYKVLAANAFGNWRNLMRDMTLNPGMGNYLNMRTSTRFSPNENYAREVLQLFNIGLFMLKPDGTLQTDAQGNPIPTYDQAVVNNFTLVFTGWSFCEASPIQCPNRTPGAPNYIDPMIASNPDLHDLSAKTLLNYPGAPFANIPACTNCNTTTITQYTNNALFQALENIYNHPNVGPFVSKFLIQQLVTGDPTPAYVGRVAGVFNANRTNPTQMKEVIRAILLDPEARGDVKTDPRYGKLREPVLYVTNIARQFDVRSADRTTLSDGVLTAETSPMRQVVFMAPSVFNFYPPEYIVPGTSFNGPEFSLYTTGTAISRINFANTLFFNRVEPNAERRVTAGTSISLADLQAHAEADPSGEELLHVLNTRMMHHAMTPQMRSTILNAIQAVPASNPLLRARRAAYLVATSSQYQVQR